MPSALRKKLSIAVILLALVVLIWLASQPPPLTIQGEVTAPRIDISSRVAGRVARLNADVGDKVVAGQELLMLESPQLVATLAASRAALDVAKADLARISSTREEIIAARKAELAAAEADIALYQESYNRFSKLMKTSSASQAMLDEAQRNLLAARRKTEAAQANLQLAVVGASPEERQLAQAQVKQAEATLHQREVDVQELVIKAPVAGQITTRVAELGENFSAGSPLFSLIDIEHQWITFNVREDLLAGLQPGDHFDVQVPALNHQQFPVKVTLVNAQGHYATWRATRATGDFDLRTFEVRAVPINAVKGLRPGMSVVALWAERDH